MPIGGGQRERLGEPYRTLSVRKLHSLLTFIRAYHHLLSLELFLFVTPCSLRAMVRRMNSRKGRPRRGVKEKAGLAGMDNAIRNHGYISVLTINVMFLAKFTMTLRPRQNQRSMLNQPPTLANGEITANAVLKTSMSDYPRTNGVEEEEDDEERRKLEEYIRKFYVDLAVCSLILNFYLICADTLFLL